MTTPLGPVRFTPSGVPAESQLTELLDKAVGSVQGMIIHRSDLVWKALDTGQVGDVLNSGGPGADVFWAPGSSYTAPTFSAFGITGQTTPLEVGATIAAGSKTFTWSTTTPANITANSISITDTTASVVLASGLANDGTEAITISAITNSAPGSQVWTIAGVDTQSHTFTRAYTVLWEFRVYAGTSANVTLTANQIKALAQGNLQASFVGSYALAALNYKYICYPDVMGDVTAFRDPSTGFLISMATASDNAAYSNVQSNGWAYDIVSVINANSITANYRVFRSQFTLGGSITFAVT